MKPAWASAARTGPVRDYMKLRIFACEGLICVIDERPGKTEGEYTILTPSDLEERIRELNRTYRDRTRGSLAPWQRQEYDLQKNGSQNCVDCIKEARAMGDPSDPSVQLFWATHRRSSTVRLNFSPGADPAGYPMLPPVDLGPRTGRTAAIDHELVTGPNLLHNVPHIHVPPKKKNRHGLILIDT